MVAMVSWRVRALSVPLLLAASMGAGCGGGGSEFLGKWENVKNPQTTMEIVRNGDQFLIIEGNDKIGAVLKDGFLEVGSGLDAIRLTHVKSTDTLTAPGLM